MDLNQFYKIVTEMTFHMNIYNKYRDDAGGRYREGQFKSLQSKYTLSPRLEQTTRNIELRKP